MVDGGILSMYSAWTNHRIRITPDYLPLISSVSRSKSKQELNQYNVIGIYRSQLTPDYLSYILIVLLANPFFIYLEFLTRCEKFEYYQYDLLNSRIFSDLNDTLNEIICSARQWPIIWKQIRRKIYIYFFYLVLFPSKTSKTHLRSGKSLLNIICFSEALTLSNYVIGQQLNTK